MESNSSRYDVRRRAGAAVIFLIATALALGASLAVFGGIGDPIRGEHSPSGPPTLSPTERASLFAPGRPWDGKGAGNSSIAALDQFDEFETYWLGPTFAGFNLQAVDVTSYEPPPGSPYPKGKAVSMGYGECTSAPCAAPVTVYIQSICDVSPSSLAPSLRSQQPETTPNGAVLQPLGSGSVLIWTGRTAITVHVTAAPERVGEAVRALRPTRATPTTPLLGAPAWTQCEGQK